ncbi:MAG: response regulator [Planctomycetota bacterium]|jgi:signal transduction histidine kinase
MEDRTYHVLVLDANTDHARRLCSMLESAHLAGATFKSARIRSISGLARELGTRSPDAMILSADPAVEAELELTEMVCDRVGTVPVILVAGKGDPATDAQAVSRGAQDCLAKWEFDDIALARAIIFAAHRKTTRPLAPTPWREGDPAIQRLITANTDAMVVLGADDRIRFANTSAEVLLAGDGKKLIGRTLAAPADGEITLRCRDEADTIVHAHSVDIEWEGRPARLLTLHDITVVRQMEHRLRQAVKMETLGRLTAGVTHDFNNKLTIITGFTGLAISQAAADSPAQESLQQVARAADHASKLVGQLLSFGRQQSMEPKVLNLNEVLGALEPSLGRMIGENIHLSIAPAESLGNVQLDPVQLEEAVINLAANARDAMEGRGELHLTTGVVELTGEYVAHHSALKSGPHVMLAVRDTGCGMNQATAEKAFDPFFTTKGKDEGTGLGLALVHGFVQECGGHITVESRPGSGTTFRMYFPQTEGPAETVALKQPSAEYQSAAGETVLVAEDEDAVRQLLIRVLSSCGYNAIEAADGQDALTKSQQHAGKIDLLITDIVMPGMDGRELATTLRQDRPDTKVIYVSGYSHGIINSDIAASEGAEFVRKPFSPDSLLGVVRQALGAGN